MRLAEFVVLRSEAILAEFEEFARTHTVAGEGMDIAALRDHGEGMLAAIAADMEQPQSERAQAEKSKGDAPAATEIEPTAAEQHGTDRAGSGFSLEEMFAEYRALRASVLRLWTESRGRLDEEDLHDLIRFNEAIDQALAESITRYSTGIEHSREMFIAILGHDLRTPLSAVLTASSFLVSEGDLAGANLSLARRIRSSGERMQSLVGDLLDFTRSRLGSGIPIERTGTDVAEIAREVVEEIAAHHTVRDIRFETTGDMKGEWDASRIAQALTNLVGNAVQHGSEEFPIEVAARGEADAVLVTIHNQGDVIEEGNRAQIFNPFKRGVSNGETREPRGSLGLGLFIAQQIAVAHGGWITVESSQENGTTFELRLPRVD